VAGALSAGNIDLTKAHEIGMGAQQQLGGGIVRGLAAALVVMAGSICAHSQERSFAPAPPVGAGQFDDVQLAPISGPLSTSTPPVSMPRSFSPRRSLQPDADKPDLSTPPDQFRLGDNYIGIQTQRSVQTPDPIRRSDCLSDEDCTDYPGPPKSLGPSSGPKTSTVRSFRKPFIGLSITAPLPQ
jgi:hypothetical protein